MEDDIHIVAEFNTPDEMNTLLQQGADINLKDEEFGATPLHTAIAHKNEKMALFLIEEGANIMLQDKQGLTPLHYAVEYDNAVVGEAILKISTDPLNIECKYGGVPLQSAVQNSYDMVKLLLKYGANKNRVSSLGGTPYDSVRNSEDDELMRLFAEY